jgi:hypothetical protein
MLSENLKYKVIHKDKPFFVMTQRLLQLRIYPFYFAEKLNFLAIGKNLGCSVYADGGFVKMSLALWP